MDFIKSSIVNTCNFLERCIDAFIWAFFEIFCKGMLYLMAVFLALGIIVMVYQSFSYSILVQALSAIWQFSVGMAVVGLLLLVSFPWFFILSGITLTIYLRVTKEKRRLLREKQAHAAWLRETLEPGAGLMSKAKTKAEPYLV